MYMPNDWNGGGAQLIWAGSGIAALGAVDVDR